MPIAAPLGSGFGGTRLEGYVKRGHARDVQGVAVFAGSGGRGTWLEVLGMNSRLLFMLLSLLD
jgi:hypothetical protein